MKIVGIALFIGLLALSVNCSAPENIIDSDSAGSLNQEVDSLQTTKDQRMDSVMRITVQDKIAPENIIKVSDSTSLKRKLIK